MTMEVTKRVEFECVYIQNKQIEAHHCKLEVTVEGPQRFSDFGRVISYESLESYMKKVVPHKAFLYHYIDLDSLAVADSFKYAGCKVECYDFEISAENLCSYFVKTLQNKFDTDEPGIRIIDLKFREDNNSYVTWKRDDQKSL